MRSLFLGCIAAASICLSLPATFATQPTPISQYQILFSPDDNVADQLIALIQKEQKSIKAAVYCLMHRGIASALVDAHHRGVKVEVIIDPYTLKSRTVVKKMTTSHLPVYVWNPSTFVKSSYVGKKAKPRKPLMHDKFCVLGDKCVWTGSFNFTFEASHSNRENVIILESADVAKKYLLEFERLKSAGCTPLEEYLSVNKENKG